MQENLEAQEVCLKAACSPACLSQRPSKWKPMPRTMVSGANGSSLQYSIISSQPPANDPTRECERCHFEVECECVNCCSIVRQEAS